MDFIINHYLWIKALHLIAVMAWMAGLFYLPRLFVYHADAENGSEFDQKLQIMERRLLRAIMNPAMILSWIFGMMLIFYHIETGGMKQGWLHTKLLFVIILTIMHQIYAYHRKQFMAGTNQKSHKYYRLINEVPTICMIIIVICAIVQPF